MNSENSYIWTPDSLSEIPVGYCDPVLIKAGKLFTLYRVSRDGKYFIIKVASVQAAAADALLRREYELSIGLSHPNIVSVFTFERHSPVGPGIVMEYIDGRSLSEFLAEKPSRQLRYRVLEQLFDALAYIHRKGIVHNDLKPDNILISRVDNTLKLIDFGLSENDAYYLTHNLGCTPKYASPELLSRSQVDARSDIYSLGLLMREILGGRRRCVWSKATRHTRERRYPCVEQMQKAMAAPRKAAMFLFPMVLVVLIGLSHCLRRNDYRLSADFLQDSLRINALQLQNDSLRLQLKAVIHDHNLAVRKTRLIDSLCAELDTEIADFFDAMSSELKNRSTQMDCYDLMSIELNRLQDLVDAITKCVSDPEILSVLNAHYVQLYNKHYVTCQEIVLAKPIR